MRSSRVRALRAPPKPSALHPKQRERRASAHLSGAYAHADAVGQHGGDGCVQRLAQGGQLLGQVGRPILLLLLLLLLSGLREVE